MSILNDEQISKLVKTHDLIHPFSENRLNSFGYDLALASDFLIPTPQYNRVLVIDPLDIDKTTFQEFNAEHCIIPPNSFVLGRSIEKIRMPNNLLGLCLSRSTYARCGIITCVTPLEPGWEGIVTIEISNTNQLPAKVHTGKGIVQVIFLTGDTPLRDYVSKGGQYQGQDRITLPRGL